MPRAVRWTLYVCALAFVSAMLVGIAASPASAYLAGPPPGATGGFGEGTCADCHFDYDVNEGRTSGLGDLRVTGLPQTYEPGQTYRITVEVSHTTGRFQWGFQLAARGVEGGAQAGVLRPADDRTHVLTQGGVQYAEQSSAGAAFNTFEIDWVAPASPAGDVSVNVAANAADGDGDSPGDYIYTTAVVVPAPR